MSKRTLSILFAIGVLALGVLSCSLVGGSDEKETDVSQSEITEEVSSSEMENEGMDEMDTNESMESEPDSSSQETSFAVPPGAKIVQSSSELLIGTTDLSIDEIIAFYRAETKDLGLEEDDLLTSIEDSTFSLVFRGSSNGKMYVLQGTSLDDNGVAFSVRYE
jgi:hypothetical protein